MVSPDRAAVGLAAGLIAPAAGGTAAMGPTAVVSPVGMVSCCISDHTRLTTVLPKIPLGFTVSTATMMKSAIVSLSSRPT